MKVDVGALKGVLANHYGNFEAESGSDGDDVSTCLYRQGIDSTKLLEFLS